MDRDTIHSDLQVQKAEATRNRADKQATSSGTPHKHSAHRLSVDCTLSLCRIRYYIIVDMESRMTKPPTPPGVRNDAAAKALQTVSLGKELFCFELVGCLFTGSESLLVMKF
jgi:hypothetical protein